MKETTKETNIATCVICGAPTDYQNGYNGHPACVAHRKYATLARDVRKRLAKTHAEDPRSIRALKLWDELSDETQFGLSVLIASMLTNFHSRRRERGIVDSRYLGPTAALELLVALIEAREL